MQTVLARIYQTEGANMKNPLEDDARWTARGNCGLHYMGSEPGLRGADCVLHAGHPGYHESAQGRWWSA
jgi:hypothetical protein